jgi:hypothetical protein
MESDDLDDVLKQKVLGSGGKEKIEVILRANKQRLVEGFLSVAKQGPRFWHRRLTRMRSDLSNLVSRIT